MIERIVAKYVNNGVKHLDRYAPDWRSNVVRPLHFLSITDHLLAQVFGPYNDVFTDILPGVSRTEAYAYGFGLLGGLTYNDVEEYHDLLIAEWEKAVAAQ